MRNATYFLLILLAIAFFNRCKKIDVPVTDLIYNLNVAKKSISADGTTIDTISVEMNDKAAVSKRYVTFQVSSGNFVNGTNGSITVPANYENNKVVAKAYFVSPFKPGTVQISVSPKLDSAVEKFILTDNITIVKSEASSIHLEPSAFGIQTNFQSEITLTGTLKNVSGNFVSTGVGVLFTDSVEGNNLPRGKFRLVNDKSDTNSKVSAVYSVPDLPAGTTIQLKATVLMDSSKLSGIKDSTIITVIP